jgi:hypothetical protein
MSVSRARNLFSPRDYAHRVSLNCWLSRIGRLFVVLCLLFALTISNAPSASAHSAANSPASNYVSKIVDVKPQTGGFAVQVIEAGSRLELRWKSGAQIEVADYDDRPYLRIGPKGVEENQQSQAVYLNRSRQGSDLPPANLNPDGPPQWKRISTEPVARWHDHRVHYMGTSIPPIVNGKEDQRVVISPWTVSFVQGNVKTDVTGQLLWVPGPSPLTYWLLAGAVALAILAIALWAGMSAAKRMKAVRIVSALTVLLVIVDAIHLFGIAFGIRGTFAQGLGRVFTVGFVSIAAWLLAIIGVVLALRRRSDAPYLLTFAGGLMAIVGGFADLVVLSRSSIPFAFGANVVRLSVTLTIGLGIGVALAGILLTRPIPDAGEP